MIRRDSRNYEKGNSIESSFGRRADTVEYFVELAFEEEDGQESLNEKFLTQIDALIEASLKVEKFRK